MIRGLALIAALSCVLVLLAARPAPAQADDPSGTMCSVVGWVSGVVGKLCGGARKVVSLGTSLFGGGGKAVAAATGLVAVGAWVVLGAKQLLSGAAHAIGATTTPSLAASWFAERYWRMAAIAAMLTIPLLMAAVIQAIVRSDLPMLAHAATVSLPLSLLVVVIAAPLTMLVLSATDEMCRLIEGAAGNPGAGFLSAVAAKFGGLTALQDPFLAFLVGLFTALGAFTVWVELVMREAAVYIVMLMLPLVFAAFVWPARRIWGVRTIELLAALILAKFAMIAVLTLGAGALDHLPSDGPSGLIAGAVLVGLAAFAPWAMTRLLPFTEAGGGATSSLRGGWNHLARAAEAARSATRTAEVLIEARSPSSDDERARVAAQAHAERLREQPGMPNPDPAGGGLPRTTDALPGGEDTTPANVAPTNGARPGPTLPDPLDGLPDVFRRPNLSTTYQLGPEGRGDVDPMPAAYGSRADPTPGGDGNPEPANLAALPPPSPEPEGLVPAPEPDPSPSPTEPHGEAHDPRPHGEDHDPLPPSGDRPDGPP